MYYKDLIEYETVNDWFADLGILNNEKKENSKRNHLQAMKKYVEFTGLSPDELIAKADSEQDSIPKYKNRSIKRYLTDFRNYLENENYSPNYIRLHMHSITSFYKNHEINLNKIKGEKARPLEENNKQLTKEIIADVLNKSSIKQRAIILAIVSSGLSSIDLRHLPLKKYKEGYNPETEVCTLYLRRHKSEVDFVTFFNKETTIQIELYLNERRKSKDPTQQIDADNSGYLFIVDQLSHPEVYLDSEYSKKQKEYIESKKEYDDAKNKGEQLPEIKYPEYAIPREDHRQYSVQGFVKMFRDLSKRCGIHSVGEHNLFRAHNIRKFFKQTLQNKNVNAEMIEMWMGHDLGGVGDAYSKYSPAQLETYMSVMHLLYINKQLDVSSNETYIELEKKMKNLEIEAETFKIERHEFIQQQEQMKQMQEKIKKLMKFNERYAEEFDYESGRKTYYAPDLETDGIGAKESTLGPIHPKSSKD
ncbi:hypothetical protein [Methanomethylovorans sp.]|uniref:hypothetical protein n=1 Tax=Methanomethylovorans sp. TaxID=2758717 RepID=UPI00351BF2F3